MRQVILTDGRVSLLRGMFVHLTVNQVVNRYALVILRLCAEIANRRQSELCLVCVRLSTMPCSIRVCER